MHAAVGQRSVQFSVESKEQINQRFCRNQQQSSGFTRCRVRHATNHHDVIPALATRCDNRPECFDMEDECDAQCDPRPSFCDDECGMWSRRRWNRNGNFVCDGYIKTRSFFPRRMRPTSGRKLSDEVSMQK